MHYADIVIVGTGHAGAQAAAMLRQSKYAGSITVVGDELDAPYERPPLSKDYLKGNKTFAQIMMRGPDFWCNHDIKMLLGQRVTMVRAHAHEVVTDTGLTIRYQYLIWAGGGSPRRITCSGNELQGVFSVRTRHDVDSMKSQLDSTWHVVVIGGGYIGLEAAAVLTQFGKSVTILEVQSRLLARVAGPCLSEFYADEHRRQGVDVRLSVSVECLIGANGRVTGVMLSDGTTLPADMVIVGIGIVPSVAPLADAGLSCANGVLVDEFCRTQLSDVFAIGDCAAHQNRYANGADPIRLESVQNANDQAKVVAKYIAGSAEPYDAVPWFWSDQYDLKLQTIGLSGGYDETVVRGDVAARRFSVVYLKQGRVLALDCVNAASDFVQGKALVRARIQVDRAALADPAIPLKTLAASVALPINKY